MTSPNQHPETSLPWYTGAVPSVTGRLAALLAVMLFMAALALS